MTVTAKILHRIHQVGTVPVETVLVAITKPSNKDEGPVCNNSVP